jgi:hypothetical protein
MVGIREDVKSSHEGSRRYIPTFTLEIGRMYIVCLSRHREREELYKLFLSGLRISRSSKTMRSVCIRGAHGGRRENCGTSDILRNIQSPKDISF